MKEAYYEYRPESLLVSHPKNINFPAHFHEALEIYYQIAGSTVVTVGERTRNMQKGDLSLMFSGCIHSYAAVPEEPESEALLIIVHLDLTGEYRQILMEMTPEDPFLCADQLHPDILYALSSLDSGEHPSSNLRAGRALIQLILSRALPKMALKKNTGQNSLLYQVVKILSREYREQVTLDDLAKRLCVSRYTISRLFSDKMGCGFPEYVNRLRLSEAEHMLVHTDSTITDISYYCGFETPRTFNRVFMKYCGMTPREYRKKQTKI